MPVPAVLALLSDPTRRGVVDTLASGEFSAGELAEQLEITPAALTRHLRRLRHDGVVDVSLDPDDNRRHVYRIRPAPFEELRDWAGDIADYWGTQLSAFATHAARTARKPRPK
jgi:DNA-binding transcriptional ArsR family regulator